ncbi:hypothetical protein L228DRAFT_283172 [Xylona heveae TC161]|uniref:Uncharacterized protein n=1 Tax=Xylona heveae (strain CBS 132557 / TC161) TaxID=1328760 RepID=A0A165GB32_XYLHT|nr:hypothetical protein L228DRAFT_283172 [Xylona heveae TC161]KZF21971.1 hypothetical protein L228DRAFT_283172 [Xylona heveae TC161]
MVYDWEGKEEICYRMYIEEKKSLEEIMEYMKTEHNFAPSKRAFQTQFKRWEFPSKQNPAHKNMPLVARVKELWERNTSQKDMLRILNEEDGFDIKERELMRVRAKNRWLLRVPNGMKTQRFQVTPAPPPPPPPPPPVNGDTTMQELEQVLLQQQDNKDGALDEATAAALVPLIPEPDLSPEVLAKRRERLEKLQAESAERWAARKRRRRTRGWAGLPADPPGPPRFPSETTIDESKQLLSLDNELYRQIRDQFQRICEECGFVKKTLAGPERWQAAKDRLIAESPHLQSVFWGSNTQLDAKALALDVVCTDVTKRMRTLERRMTIAEAKNALNINPEESRQIRNAFYETLRADHFTSKLEAGDEHWRELKDQWIQSSDLLKQILAPGDADPNHATKVKAIEVLCRDVMKRLRDDQTKRDPSRKKSTSASASAALPPLASPEAEPHPDTVTTSPVAGVPAGSSAAPPVARAVGPPTPMQPDHGDLQIDPSLLLAANDPSLTMDQQQQHHQFATPSFVSATPYPPPPTTIPIYFRLSPLSQMPPSAPKLWLGTLTSNSVAELRQLATAKHPGTSIVRIEGMVKDGNGNEVSFEIDEDDELDAYLAHVGGGKAIIVVQLANAFV